LKVIEAYEVAKNQLTKDGLSCQEKLSKLLLLDDYILVINSKLPLVLKCY